MSEESPIDYIRIEPIVPEAYLCAWADRYRLQDHLLAQGKGMMVREQPGIPGQKNFTRFRHVLITVDSYT